MGGGMCENKIIWGLIKVGIILLIYICLKYVC